jgi:hypothetical protein
VRRGELRFLSVETGCNDPCDDFYRATLRSLLRHRIPFLVGGAYALKAYTGIHRNTKDLDLMVLREDVERALEVLRDEGYRTAMTFSHWLAKVHYGEAFIDIIFNAGNGLCPVDDLWFRHGRQAEAFGVAVQLCPPEELIWQKAYVMERERFDGADVIHLLRSCAGQLDWRRLLMRFGADSGVLLAHLVLFGFVYPSERGLVPAEVLQKLADDLLRQWESPSPERICNGTLLSREQYLADIERWRFADGRAGGRSSITPGEIEAWTAAIAAPEGRAGGEAAGSGRDPSF